MVRMNKVERLAVDFAADELVDAISHMTRVYEYAERSDSFLQEHEKQLYVFRGNLVEMKAALEDILDRDTEVSDDSQG